MVVREVNMRAAPSMNKVGWMDVRGESIIVCGLDNLFSLLGGEK